MDNMIKVLFTQDEKVSAISWVNHVDEIINGIESGEQDSFKVYMKKLMPIKEMDNVAKELCDTIKYHFNCEAKFIRHEECIAAGYTNMLASATYDIILTH